MWNLSASRRTRLEEETAVEKLRLGVIGIGNMGSEHCRLILAGRTPEVELCCVADPRADRRAWAQAELPKAVRVYPDGEALIRARGCDAALIATPHALHPPLALLALEHGLHVLSEKPAGVSARQVRPVLEAARRSGLTYALMFNQRTNGVYRRLRALVAGGALGEMKRVHWIITDWYRSQRYYDSGSWRATWRGEGGGVLINQCPHQLDLLQWICGMPTAVRAFCHEGKWHDIEVEDDVTAYLEFPNGATGVFVASTGDLPGTNRLEIDGDAGKVVCENDQILFWKLPFGEKSHYRCGPEPYPHPDVPPVTVEPCEGNPQHAGVINAFAAHVLRGEALVADGAEGLNALMLSNAMHLSSWIERVVKLPFDEEAFERLLRQRQLRSRPARQADVTFETDHSATGRAL